MAFLDDVLDPPSYGYRRDGLFYVPTRGEMLREFGGRLNIFQSRKNWLPLFSWVASLSLAVPLGVFLFSYFSWPLVVAGFFYGMVGLGSHGTFWLHRYGTHRAFKFRNPLVRTLCRNLVLRVIPEEIYVISHHVHHRFPEKAGDPYNVHGGWLYCFLADATHQMINPKLSEKDYRQVCRLLEHTGVALNTYAQFQKWGSACHPLKAIGHYALNWGFWYGTFYLAGGHALATALFGAAGVWGIGVRMYNFDGHGRGKDVRREGIDFNRDDLSVNQLWPGFVAGEWHNNHHLYPNGARSGFLPGQIDLPWYLICGLRKLGWVHSLRDYKEEFMRDYYLPYLMRSAQKFHAGAQVSEALAGLPSASARATDPSVSMS